MTGRTRAAWSTLVRCQRHPGRFFPLPSNSGEGKGYFKYTVGLFVYLPALALFLAFAVLNHYSENAAYRDTVGDLWRSLAAITFLSLGAIPALMVGTILFAGGAGLLSGLDSFGRALLRDFLWYAVVFVCLDLLVMVLISIAFYQLAAWIAPALRAIVEGGTTVVVPPLIVLFRVILVFGKKQFAASTAETVFWAVLGLPVWALLVWGAGSGIFLAMILIGGPIPGWLLLI